MLRKKHIGLSKILEEMASLTRAGSHYGDVHKGSIKSKFKTTSSGYLKLLAHELGFTDSKVCFLPGGVAVPGEASLYGMWNNTQGLAIYVFPTSSGANIMFRRIKSITDYTGESNQWIHDVTNRDTLALLGILSVIVHN